MIFLLYFISNNRLFHVYQLFQITRSMCIGSDSPPKFDLYINGIYCKIIYIYTYCVKEVMEGLRQKSIWDQSQKLFPCTKPLADEKTSQVQEKCIRCKNELLVYMSCEGTFFCPWICLTQVKKVDNIVAELVQYCSANDISNPVEILSCYQSIFVQGRALEIKEPSVCEEGDTNVIFIDSGNVLDTGFDEVDQIQNLRTTLEIEFYGEIQ